MNGLDVWFDNQWAVRHLPPKTPSDASRFMQDVYRWTYEVAKLDVANHRIGLRPITPDSLEPYPAPWITDQVHKRIFLTSLLRTIAGPERRAYWHVFAHARSDARAWAQRTSESYLAFQTYWSGMMAALWMNAPLADAIVESGTPRPGTRRPRPAREGEEGPDDGRRRRRRKRGRERTARERDR
jgi:hypothetical protein